MRNLVFVAVALAVLGFTLTARADAPPNAAERDVQDFVFLGDKGPVLMRFHLRIDGKPLLDVWEAYVGKIFDYLDVDGDGVLSKDEAARTPPVQALFNNVINARPFPAASNGPDLNQDGKVTREELAQWYRQNGAAPFQFRTGGNQQQRVVFAFAGQAQPLPADKLNKKLFELLDANKDGKLSHE
jgi:hypothetical protein